MDHPLLPPYILRIFVSEACPLTERVAGVTAAVQRELPCVFVEIVDVDTTADPLPDVMFSVPTYVLNGHVISLGNPDSNFVSELRALLNRGRSCKMES